MKQEMEAREEKMKQEMEAREEKIKKESIKEGMEKGVKKGVKKGIKEGERRIYIRLIIDTLNNSFGQLNAAVIRMIKNINDPDVLHILLKQAKHVTSPDAFVEILKALIEE